MSKIKLLTVAVIGLLIINLGMLSFLLLAPQRHRPPGMGMAGREGPADMIISRLHFSEAQVTAYDKLIQAHRASIRSLDAQIRETKNALYKTLAEASPENKDSLKVRLGNLQQQIETVHYDHFTEIKKLCNPGQLNYFNELTADLASYFSPNKNPPHPGDGPPQ